MLLRAASDSNEPRRATAAARMLGLTPATGGEIAVTFQLIETLLQRRGEVRIIRVGTATVAIAGNEIGLNEVGGDGPNVTEAVVSATCDLVRFDAAREAIGRDAFDDTGNPDDDSQTLFAW